MNYDSNENAGYTVPIDTATKIAKMIKPMHGESGAKIVGEQSSNGGANRINITSDAGGVLSVIFPPTASESVILDGVSAGLDSLAYFGYKGECEVVAMDGNNISKRMIF